MRRVLSITSLILTVLLILSCRSSSDIRQKTLPVNYAPLTEESLAGTAWTRPVCGMPGEGQFSEEGFYLAGDGALLYLNIFSMTGDRWELKEGKLFLYSHTERYPEPEPVIYDLRLEENTLTLYPEENTGEGIVYSRGQNPDAVPEGAWTLQYLRNPEGIAIPDEEMPYFEIQADEDAWRIGGFSGVNRFFGSLEFSGGSWKGCPFMSTMMAGPYLEYEQLFLKTLESTDRYLRIDNALFLFSGTEAAAFLQRN